MNIAKSFNRFVFRLRRKWWGGQLRSAGYYQKLHDTSVGYQENNWLLSEMDRALACDPKLMVEIGCGNAKFLRAAAGRVETVIGLDWAISPKAVELPPNASLRQSDVTKDVIPPADLICSADVLEHFAPDIIDGLLGKLHQSARFNFHVIACYDDNHSHLTIIPPEAWLKKFQTLSPEYRMVATSLRRNKEREQICVIANY